VLNLLACHGFFPMPSPPPDNAFKPSVMPQMRHLLLLGAALFGSASCNGRATPVAVTNHSAKALEQVVIAGSGFQQSLGTIDPGATIRTEIRPRGESGLAVSFNSGARRVSVPPQGYFEAGGEYAVTVVVTPNLEVAVDGDLRIY